MNKRQYQGIILLDVAIHAFPLAMSVALILLPVAYVGRSILSILLNCMEEKKGKKKKERRRKGKGRKETKEKKGKITS
jgi:hypothetical protein